MLCCSPSAWLSPALPPPSVAAAWFDGVKHTSSIDDADGVRFITSTAEPSQPEPSLCNVSEYSWVAAADGTLLKVNDERRPWLKGSTRSSSFISALVEWTRTQLCRGVPRRRACRIKEGQTLLHTNLTHGCAARGETGRWADHPDYPVSRCQSPPGVPEFSAVAWRAVDAAPACGYPFTTL